MPRPRYQLSILGLLVLATVVAVVMAGIVAYRQSFAAQLRWIDLKSSEAAQLFPTPNIIQNASGEYEFEYYATHQNIQRLLAVLRASNFSVSEEAVKLTNLSKPDADTALAKLTSLDVLPAGHYVIRGRILDANGQSVSKATIDILGDFNFINCFATRHDGTFTLALTDEDPNFKGNGSYSFRIRSSDESRRWESMSFTLDAAKPERVVEIHLND